MSDRSAMKKPGPVDIHVGGRIRLQRKLRGLSQTALGERLGITFQQVQKYEKGANRVGSSRLQEIADALGVPVTFFFEGQAEGAAISREIPNDHPDEIIMFIKREGIALNRAFAKIRDVKIRRKIILLAEALATAEFCGAVADETNVEGSAAEQGLRISA